MLDELVHWGLEGITRRQLTAEYGVDPLSAQARNGDPVATRKNKSLHFISLLSV
jgi:hypothetical protein